MQPARARIGEPAGHLDRVVAVGRLAAEVALAEPNDATAAQVDRRQELERSCFVHVTMLPY